MSAEFFTGDDWTIQVTLKKDGAAYDFSTATDVSASVVSSDKVPAVLVAAVSANSGDAGADWANGVLILDFPAASTANATDSVTTGLIEIQVTIGGKKITWPRPSIKIIKGTIA